MNHQFQRGHDQSLAPSKTHTAHVRRRIKVGAQERGNIRGINRTVDNRKAGLLLDFMGRNACGGKLGQNQAAVCDNLMQATTADLADQFVRSERSFAGRAPDVDAGRIQNQYPGVQSGQRAP